MKIKNAILICLTALSISISNGQENKTYNVTKIGAKEWMVENLNISTFRNGETIPEAKTVEEWKKAGEDKKPAWCHYENKTENGTQYGKMYNWYAVSDERGLAPKGWHIPTYKEWTTNDNSLGGLKSAGKKMKSTSGWSQDGNGNNSSGFTALPGGFRSSTGLFQLTGEYGFWWSSEQDTGDNAWLCFLHCKDNGTNGSSRNKSAGLSVRCVKD